MDLELRGMAGPDGWPAEGCRCASCNRLRAAGIRHAPARVLVDGVPPAAHPRRRAVPGGHDVAGRLLVAGGPGERPEPEPGAVYEAVLLDLVGAPEHLGRLRRAGAVTDRTEVHALYVDHRVPSPAELERRMGFWSRPPGGPWRTVLLGGSRSGKSAEAELRLMGHPDVTYVATGPHRPGDAEWTARVEAHRRRRPDWWRTVETVDLPPLLESATGALLVDGIGTWLTAVMDETGAWEDPAAVAPRLDALVAAWRATSAQVIAVSDEVGLSLVSPHRAGRAFADALGRLNQRLVAESEEAALVVAGRVVELA
ncbi:bifunctional adenosylcobinamide kinase/adenosylcobinamide-phosphate guanylyltransferase [Actinomadura kijaniata]|uniref:bifunctional adenosylcobinamide kinase/adenosylcobinamide-phosphate guanylyltransferase n=1 Tax=Actinomadura kijaniata TaxID=46161 RepID=UPI003F19DE74